MENKPQGYPYITVRYDGSRYRPIMIDWLVQHGYEQVVDELPSEYTPQDAKSAAVRWAKRESLPYKAPIQ